MEWSRRNPAVIPAVGLVTGAALAPQLEWLPLPLLALLLAASIALGGRVGVGCGALAIGLWLALPGNPGDLPAGFDGGRPVLVEGRMLDPLRCEIDGRGSRSPEELRSSVRMRVGMLSQGSPRGRRIAETRFDVWVSAEGCDPRWVPGSHWRIHGLLRRSAGYRNDPVVLPGPWRLVVVSDRLVTPVAPSPSLSRRVDHGRRHALSLIDRPGGPRLLATLLLGERAGLDERLEQALRRAGLAHLLAVSGLHVAVLAGLVWIVGMPLPRWARLVAVATVVVVYLLLLGPRPSVLRSASMTLVALFALVLERPPQALNTLAVVVVGLVVGDPSRVLAAGFQLSVAATAGILVLVPVLSRLLPGPEALARALAVPLSAQLATLPWTVGWNAGIHPLAAGLDLLAVPWLAAYLAGGVVALLSALLGGPDLLAGLVILENPVAWLADFPPSPLWFLPLRIEPETLGLLWVLAIVGLLGLGSGRDGGAAIRDEVEPGGDREGRPPQGRRRLLAPIVCVPMLLALLLRGAAEPRAVPPQARFLDVGQGDGALLVADGQAVLIDGGGWWRGDFGGRVVVPALVRAGVSRLRAVVLTHPDRDHCRGLVDVARWLPVDEVWMSPGWEATCAHRLVALPGSRWRPLWADDRRRLGPWSFEVLHPEPGHRTMGNDRSLVLRATVEGRGILLTGDLEEAAERRLVDRHGDHLATTLLKVAHHGSKTSTTARWLDAVEPRVAIVSAGRSNLYGHPNHRVLRRLDRHRVLTLRTDRDGMVRWSFPVGRRPRADPPLAVPRGSSRSRPR